MRWQPCFPIKYSLVLTSKLEYWKGYAIGLSFMAFVKLLVPSRIYELCPVQRIFLEQPGVGKYWAITFDVELIPLRTYGVINI